MSGMATATAVLHAIKPKVAVRAKNKIVAKKKKKKIWMSIMT